MGKGEKSSEEVPAMSPRLEGGMEGPYRNPRYAGEPWEDEVPWTPKVPWGEPRERDLTQSLSGTRRWHIFIRCLGGQAWVACAQAPPLVPALTACGSGNNTEHWLHCQRGAAVLEEGP